MKKLFHFLWLLPVVGIIILFNKGCSNDLEKSLLAAGGNRGELQKVLDHYKQNEADSLKWKAARFLIENMPMHYTYYGPAVDTFYTAMKSVFKDPQNKGQQFYTTKYDSLFAIWGDRLKRADMRMDVESVTADYLIRNIDEAFRMWQMPWAKHYSFEIFCEYILPYRVGKEPLSDWRPIFINRKPTELDLAKHAANKTYLYGMCNSLNQKYVTNLYYAPSRIPEYPLAVLENVKSATCSSYASLVAAQMRAMGIPVAIDFTPQWGKRSMGHEWNALIISETISIPLSINDALGYHLYTYFEEVFPKVFRRTYQHQKESLYYLSQGEVIPELFNTPFIKDVTVQYLPDVKDLEVTFFDDYKHSKFAYLSVFNNKDWEIVHWARVKGNKGVFKAMGTECVYLPVQYLGNAETRPISWPILCSVEGNKLLIPDTSKRKTLHLTRKYRYSRNLEQCAKRVEGGRFQVANNPDFSDSVTVHVITNTPECSYQKVNLSYEGDYKYFRYLGPAESYCNMAEIELYDINRQKLATDSVFSIDGGNQGYEDYKCFDGNALTYYNANWNPHNGWVAVEFPEPVHLSYLYYLPRNDENYIREGDLYELFYWDKYGWKSLGRRKGVKQGGIWYNNAPENALFLLYDYMGGDEERIFTYEKGKQVWW